MYNCQYAGNGVHRNHYFRTKGRRRQSMLQYLQRRMRSGVAIAYHINESDTMTFNMLRSEEFDQLIHDFADAPRMKPQITRLNAPCINRYIVQSDAMHQCADMSTVGAIGMSILLLMCFTIINNYRDTSIDVQPKIIFYCHFITYALFVHRTLYVQCRVPKENIFRGCSTLIR